MASVVESDEVVATVLPDTGARLHALEVFGVNLLRTPPDPSLHIRDPLHWGAYHMAPWCNRIATGSVTGYARPVDLRPNFPGGYAIHGQLLRVPWTPMPDGALSVAGGGDRWPWTYRASVRLAANGPTLRVDYRLENTSDAAMPGGIGLHPWFKRPLLVRVPARQVFPDNTVCDDLPQPVEGALDLRAATALPADIDATWTDLDTPAIELAWPQDRIAATMTIRARQAVVVGANPTRLDATAVEPQTHAPHGLERLQHRRPYAIDLIAPGETLTLGLAIAFRRTTNQR